MKSEFWTVSDKTGEEIGVITKLIIDGQTRSITHAELAYPIAYRIVRVPWTEITIKGEQVRLARKAEELPSFPSLKVVDSLPGKLHMETEPASRVTKQLASVEETGQPAQAQRA